MATTSEKMRRRIQCWGRGAIFIAQDFLDLGGRDAVDQTLSRLAHQGELRRVARGLYYYPRISTLLGEEVPPMPQKVAEAMARKMGGRIQITGARAANELGLSTQVPAHNVFLTDGRYRKVKVGNQTVELRHAAPRHLKRAGHRESAVLQALRYLGEDNISAEVIERLGTTLSKQEKAALRRDKEIAPSWLLPIVEQIISIQ